MGVLDKLMKKASDVIQDIMDCFKCEEDISASTSRRTVLRKI